MKKSGDPLLDDHRQVVGLCTETAGRPVGRAAKPLTLPLFAGTHPPFRRDWTSASQRGKPDHFFRMFGSFLGRHRKTPIAPTVGVFYFPPSAPYLDESLAKPRR